MSTNVSRFDDVGRPIVTEEIKGKISAALDAIEPGKKGALLVIADTHGARAMLATKINEHWKVVGGAGVPWSGGTPNGWVGVHASW